jgi:alkyl hydroperoxide reductase subunit AhpC
MHRSKTIDFTNEYIKGHWGLLFSHPAAFTPVCTTELGAVANAYDELADRDVKYCGLSCDSVERNVMWI